MSVKSAFNNPSTDGPNFDFNTGAVQNSIAIYYPYTADIPYAVNPQWGIIGWHSDTFLDPAVFTEANQLYADAVLGTPDYTWTNKNATMVLSVYGTNNQFTYRLTVKDGSNGASADIGDTSPGGRNLFLSTMESAAADYTFDKQITFTAEERLSQVFATGNGNNPTSGGNSFIVSFNNPTNPYYDPSLPNLSGFLQFPLADSRGSPPQWGQSHFSGSTFAWNAVSSNGGGDYMVWGADEGGLHTVTIDLSSAIVGLAEKLSSTYSAYSSSLMDMSLWSLGTYFYGGESLDGSGATFDIANPVITRDDTQDFDASMASSNFVTISNNYQTVYDTGMASTATSQSWFVSSSSDTSINMDGQTISTNVILPNADTVYAGSADGYIFANGPSMKLIGGSGYTVPVLSKGDDTVIGGSGRQLVFIGTGGNLTYQTDAAVAQPGGDDSYRHWVVGDGANQDQTLNFVGGGVKSAIFLGYENATLQLGNAGDFVSIGFGDTRDVIGGGTTAITMGAGDDTVWVNSATSGPLSIYDFDPLHDHIVLSGQKAGITHTYQTDDGSTRYLLNSGKYLDIYTASDTKISAPIGNDQAIIMI